MNLLSPGLRRSIPGRILAATLCTIHISVAEIKVQVYGFTRPVKCAKVYDD